MSNPVTRSAEAAPDHAMANRKKANRWKQRRERVIDMADIRSGWAAGRSLACSGQEHAVRHDGVATYRENEGCRHPLPAARIVGGGRSQITRYRARLAWRRVSNRVWSNRSRVA